MSFVNRARRPLLVSSDFSVGEYAHFANDFRADAFALTRELVAIAESADPATLPATYLMWRYDNAPALPTDPDLGTLASALPPYLENGHAAILAIVEPGQELSEAAALLVGFDGGQWLGTAASLQSASSPYVVQPFNEYVLTQTAGQAR